MNVNRILASAVSVLLAITLAGCATGTTVRTDFDESADFAAYATFGWAPELGTGYYGYRYGLYTAWPLYAPEVETVHYEVGTANVDVVDADARQLIWEGVAEGRLTEEALENPAEAIENAVEDMFAEFPTRRSP